MDRLDLEKLEEVVLDIWSSLGVTLALVVFLFGNWLCVCVDYHRVYAVI